MVYCQESPLPGLHIEAPEKTGRWAGDLAELVDHPSQNLGFGPQGSTGTKTYSGFVSSMILSLRDYSS